MLRCAFIILISGGCWASTCFADVTQNVVLLLDDSGSMADRMRSGPRVAKIDAAKNALKQVLGQLPDDARVGVFALNSRSDNGPWIIPLEQIDRAQILRAVDGIRAQGGTPLGAAMKEAADALLALRERYVYGDYRLLIVTDGEAQDEHLVDQYLPEIINRQLTVDVIGVSMAQNHSLATRVDRYRRADDPAALQVAIQQSLAETPLDPQDPDEASDFELLAGFPEEAAVAAIEALTRRDNRPLGESAPTDRAGGAPNQDLLPPLVSNQPPSGPVPDQPEPQGSGVSKVMIFGIILMMIVLLKSVLRAARQRRY